MTHATEKTLIKQFILVSWKLWLTGILVGALLGLGSTYFVRPHYEGSISFNVSKKEVVTQDKVNFYLYDGFYTSQASTAARSDLAAWLVSPVNVEQVLRKSGLQIAGTSVEELSRIFKTSKPDEASSVLDVSYTAGTKSEAELIGESLVSIVKTNYNQDSITVKSSHPLIVMVEPNKLIVGLGLTVAVTVLAFALSLVIHYFRND